MDTSCDRLNTRTTQQCFGLYLAEYHSAGRLAAAAAETPAHYANTYYGECS